MNIPQTQRQPVELSTQEAIKLLAIRHPQDVTDYFATDPTAPLNAVGGLRFVLNRLKLG